MLCRFGGLIFGGAYFRNFTVFANLFSLSPVTESQKSLSLSLHISEQLILFHRLLLATQVWQWNRKKRNFWQFLVVFDWSNQWAKNT